MNSNRVCYGVDARALPVMGTMSGFRLQVLCRPGSPLRWLRRPLLATKAHSLLRALLFQRDQLIK